MNRHRGPRQPGVEFGELDRAQRLDLVRRGTAYFARLLAELTDTDFDAGTLLPGWSRRHLVAHIGNNAAALGRLLNWAATGIETPMYASTAQRTTDIEEGATQSPTALRNVFQHSATRLEAGWRNLSENAWRTQVRTAQGRTVPVTETLWMRTREIWVHAVDLRAGGEFGDFPTVVSNSLLIDVVRVWRNKDLGAGTTLAVDGRDPIAVDPSAPTILTVAGALPAVVRWATGRGAADVTLTGTTTSPPPWL